MALRYKMMTLYSIHHQLIRWIKSEAMRMNLQFHRKQLALSGFAMVLAVATYVIPDPSMSLPHPASQTSDTESTFAPAEESVLIDGNWSQSLLRHSALI